LRFLERKREGSGFWRFWCSGDRRHTYFPPDIDDTALASFVLTTRQPTVLDNREILLDNRDANGALYTWIVPRRPEQSEWLRDAGFELSRNCLARLAHTGSRDTVDAVANANALLYLGDCALTESVSRFIVDIILEGNERNWIPYYPGLTSLYYAVGRAYLHGAESMAPVSDPVVDRVVGLLRSGMKDELAVALGACAMMDYGYTGNALPGAVCSLLDSQGRDGAWPIRPAFLGPAPYYGSAELTTAIAIEAVARFRALLVHS
jgi:hypothetical protein